MNPMVDGWMGDDWFHYGAFREQNMPYIYEQEATRKNDEHWWTSHYDDYDMYLQAGSAKFAGRARLQVHVVIVVVACPPVLVVFARGFLLVDIRHILFAKRAVVKPVVAQDRKSVV